jgi:hypothetical protein
VIVVPKPESPAIYALESPAIYALASADAFCKGHLEYTCRCADEMCDVPR